ncbi:MAG: hypothetical protein AB8G22_00875 [Saprospiraceae bacterium]
MKIIYSLLLFFASCQFIFAQTETTNKLPLTITVFNHSVGIPFKDFIKTPLNFGVSIGTEFTYRQAENSSYHQQVAIGYYYHKNLNSALYLKSDFVYRYTTNGGWFGEVQVGAGYLRDFNEQLTFKRSEAGEYLPQKSRSYGGMIAGGGVGTGFRMQVNEQLNIVPFARYEGFFQFPYSELTSVFPHSLLHVGSRLEFK